MDAGVPDTGPASDHRRPRLATRTRPAVSGGESYGKYLLTAEAVPASLLVVERLKGVK